MFLLPPSLSMPPKCSQENPSDPQPPKRCTHCSAGNTQPDPGLPVKSESVPKILWDTNPWWTDHLVTYLAENVNICLKMFSDSTSQAKEEGCKKVHIVFLSYCQPLCCSLQV